MECGSRVGVSQGESGCQEIEKAGTQPQGLTAGQQLTHDNVLPRGVLNPSGTNLSNIMRSTLLRLPIALIHDQLDQCIDLPSKGTGNR